MSLDATTGASHAALPLHDAPPLGGLMPPLHSADMAQTMAARIMSFAPISDSEALKLLRASFPGAPLSLRVAALDFLNRRGR